MASYKISRWTQEELDFLEKNYQSGPLSSQDIADHLGRSKAAIKAIANKNGWGFKSAEKPPEGFARCSRCKEVFPISDFHKSRSHASGRSTACKYCERLRSFKYKQELKVAASHVCSRCKVEKPKSEYHRSSSNKNGLASWCKECDKIRRKK